MKKHILPFSKYNLPWRGEEMKQYRKMLPNYVVVLVSKVLDTAEEVALKEEGRKRTPADKFYQIATYCKINYLKKYT